MHSNIRILRPSPNVGPIQPQPLHKRPGNRNILLTALPPFLLDDIQNQKKNSCLRMLPPHFHMLPGYGLHLETR